MWWLLSESAKKTLNGTVIARGCLIVVYAVEYCRTFSSYAPENMVGQSGGGNNELMSAEVYYIP